MKDILKKSLNVLGDSLKNASTYYDYFLALKRFCAANRFDDLSYAYDGAMRIWKVLNEYDKDEINTIRELSYTLYGRLCDKLVDRYGQEDAKTVHRTIYANW